MANPWWILLLDKQINVSYKTVYRFVKTNFWATTKQDLLYPVTRQSFHSMSRGSCFACQTVHLRRVAIRSWMDQISFHTGPWFSRRHLHNILHTPFRLAPHNLVLTGHQPSLLLPKRMVSPVMNKFNAKHILVHCIWMYWDQALDIFPQS